METNTHIHAKESGAHDFLLTLKCKFEYNIIAFNFVKRSVNVVFRLEDVIINQKKKCKTIPYFKLLEGYLNRMYEATNSERAFANRPLVSCRLSL